MESLKLGKSIKKNLLGGDKERKKKERRLSQARE